MQLISVRNADIIYEILSLASWIRSIIMPKDSSTHKFTSSQMIPQDAAASKLKLSFSLSGTLASMGCGLPYALAARIAYPERHV